jgi:hypothetical protein
MAAMREELHEVVRVMVISHYLSLQEVLGDNFSRTDETRGETQGQNGNGGGNGHQEN